MVAVLAFAVTLLPAVRLSNLAGRTVLSTTVLFLLLGVAVGDLGLGLLTPGPDAPVIRALSEPALAGVLYTGGMRAGITELREGYRLPGRARNASVPGASAPPADVLW